jgi:hypothetical protein
MNREMPEAKNHRKIEYAFDLTDEQSKELESMLIRIGLYAPSTANPFKITLEYSINFFSSEKNQYKFFQLHYYNGLGKTQTFNIDNTWSGINNFNSILNLITPLIREYKINNLINE